MKDDDRCEAVREFSRRLEELEDLPRGQLDRAHVQANVNAAMIEVLSEQHDVVRSRLNRLMLMVGAALAKMVWDLLQSGALLS